MAFDYEACNHGSFIVNYKSGRREMGNGKGERGEEYKEREGEKMEGGKKEDRVRRRKRKK